MSMASRVIDLIGFGPYQLQVMAILCTVAFLGNANLGLVAFVSSPWQRYFSISDWERSMIPVGYNFLGVFSSIFFGFLADHYGRLRTLQLCHAMTLLFSIVCVLAPTAKWIFISQWCLGIFRPPTVLFVVYASEFLPTYMKRWTIVVTTSMALSYTAYATMPFIINPNLYWREFVFLYLPISSLLATILIFKLPQSPHFRVTEKDDSKANQVLIAMARSNGYHLGSLFLQNVTAAPEEVTEKGVMKHEKHSIFEFKKEIFLIVFTTFVSGMGNVPFRNMAVELSKYSGNPCNVKGTASKSFQCSEVKYLTKDDFLEGLYVTLGPLILIPLAIPLSKMMKLVTIIRLYTCFIPISMIPIVLCLSPTLQKVSLVFLCANNLAICFTTFVYLGELLPTSCRALGTSLLLAMDRIELVLGFVLVEKLLYVSYRGGFITLIVLAAFGGVTAMFLPES